MDEKHILVSLGDEKVREIGEVIGNKSCNRILDLLAEGELTVSDIARKLKMPINTVDYNVKKLVKAGLIESLSHWWSVKGKKMPTYRVSNRKIIISPRKSAAGVFAWVFGLTGLSALTLREVMKSTEVVISEVPRVMAEFDSLAGSSAVESVGFWGGLGPWSWFLIGAWFAVFLFFIITLYNGKGGRL